MEPILNEYEVRVIGALVEKQITTPDYYPLTLNSLLNACNQKNNRNPVVAYDEETVRRALDGLREKNIAYVFHGSESRVPKYGHLFPKAYDLNPAETAILCVLMLRGPQTPGELRSRAANMHAFASLAEVESTIEGLLARTEDQIIVRLPRQTGMKESRYAHLLSGPVDFDVLEMRPTGAVASSVREDRLSQLEQETLTLRRELDELREQFAAFRRQFE
ncbi:MAG: YceH family protein [Acidobacteria bacterium]|nr:YceH family protein [Acidobacteriota bacterium]MCW5968885.1 YceH family protein [Blastocatellales bacterium]